MDGEGGGAERVVQSGVASGRSAVLQAGRDLVVVVGERVGSVPPLRAPVPTGVFVGRDDELARLGSATEGSGRVVAVHGLGGVGKSTLVARFAELHRDRYELVWWITADSRAAVGDGLAELAVGVRPDLAAAPLEQRVEAGLRWLAAHRDWLVVLDDLESPSDADVLLSRVRTGAVVITSRRGTGWRGVPTVALDVLPPGAAEELLAGTARADWPDADLDGARRLCDELGQLPLAVHQAGAYLAQNRITPTSYLALLDRYPARVFTATGEGADARRTMARVWRVTQDRLADTPAAGRVLRELAWYAPDDIHRAFLGDDDVDVLDALGRLAAYSMIRLDRHAVSVHRLVQAVSRTPDPDDPHRRAEDVAAARDAATTALSRVVGGLDRQEPGAWPVYRAVLPHARALLDHSDPADDTAWTSALLNGVGLFLAHQGDLATATAHFTRALRNAEDSGDHQGVAALRNNLAQAWTAAGEHALAIAGHEAALADSLEALGPDHPHTLVSRTNLANTYLEARDVARAAPLYEKSLAECRRAVGDDHPSTLEARVNLVRGLRHSGDLAGAVTAGRRAVAECERVLGGDHVSTFTARNNLATALLELGHVRQAVRIFEALARDEERALGADHPDALTARLNLASAYREAGLVRLAAVRHREVAAHVERVLGPTHPLTFAARNDLSTTLLAAGEVRGALSSSAETLERARRRFGDAHPLTLVAMNNHALARDGGGDHAAAVELLEAARDTLERDLGPDHPQALTCRDNLASALWDAGRHERAVAEFHSVIADRERVLGADHPATLNARANLRHALTGSR
ncbi:FxSxx-COOH system tetratricopeptide repeat protein [Saccharothrix sp. HUAS TT1]|uniref:FxSxx-COOH system tetratricopeptide repeat protein n=1 Tax=unclassified Saccharothrix TaxID=2593673 RepID=UPI00345B78D6